MCSNATTKIDDVILDFNMFSEIITFENKGRFGKEKHQNLDVKVKVVSNMALSDGRKTICKVGTIQGYVAEMLRGENGFGFDEIFEMESGKTLAELSQEEKIR